MIISALRLSERLQRGSRHVVSGCGGSPLLPAANVPGCADAPLFAIQRSSPYMPPVACGCQVTTHEVYDVGLVTPCELQPFFSGCSFEPDREESVPMAFAGLVGDGLAGGGEHQPQAAAAGCLGGMVFSVAVC
jgi:hypothetical protein